MHVPHVQMPNVPLMPSNTNSLLYYYIYLYYKYTTEMRYHGCEGYYSRIGKHFDCSMPDGMMVCFKFFVMDQGQEWVNLDSLGNLVLFFGTFPFLFHFGMFQNIVIFEKSVNTILITFLTCNLFH